MVKKQKKILAGQVRPSPKKAKNDPLASWQALNVALPTMTDAECEKLLQKERENENRFSYKRRILQRISGLAMHEIKKRIGNEQLDSN